MKYYKLSEEFSLGIRNDRLEILALGDYRNVGYDTTCFYYPNKIDEIEPAFRCNALTGYVEV